MRALFLFFFVLIIHSCTNDVDLDDRILMEYIEQNESLQVSDLVACAGGRKMGLLGNDLAPTDIIYYPIEGATNIRYYETDNLSDSSDLSTYVEMELEIELLFNGYLEKFNREPFDGEKMGIVTYETPGKIHISNPIRLKTNVTPTEENHDLININENGTTPSFSWTDGSINENIIYFHVISDHDNNLISGTYTTEKEFTFYNLDNVVFNITDPDSNPSLISGLSYKFTLMGVSQDNWINLYSEKVFVAN